MTDTPYNHLSLPDVLALTDEQLAEFVATRYFRWTVVNPSPQIFKCKSADRSVKFATRPFRPTQSADDDHLALRWARRHARNIIPRMGVAMLAIARARLQSEIDPCCVSVYASRGDYCRALLLATSTVYRPGHVEPDAQARAPEPDAQAREKAVRPTSHTQHKEPHHEHQLDATRAGPLQAPPKSSGQGSPVHSSERCQSSAAAPTGSAADSEAVGAGAATPAPLPAVHSHSE